MHKKDQAYSPAIEHRLFKLLFDKDSNETRNFSEEEVWHYYPKIILTFNPTLDSDQLDPKSSSIMRSFFKRAGVEVGMTVAEIDAAIDAYYKKNPANRKLVQALEDFVAREISMLQETKGTGFANFAGTSSMLANVAQRNEETPEGAVSAKPWSRFSINKNLEGSARG